MQRKRKRGVAMLIKGLQKLTLLDYPEKLACTVFIGGCNFRCPFCHNASLVLPQKALKTIPTEEFLDFLDSRIGRLDGVCVSGGEPTLMPDLVDLIREIKKRGFLVKLDTNGSHPHVLRALIDEGLLDYVAMDIKNSPERYGETIGYGSELEIENSNLMERIKESVSLLMQGRVDYEFRTTVMAELHGIDEMRAIGQWLSGAKRHFLQNYRPEGEQLVGGLTPLTPEEMNALLSEVKKYIPSAEIRG